MLEEPLGLIDGRKSLMTRITLYIYLLLEPDHALVDCEDIVMLHFQVGGNVTRVGNCVSGGGEES